MELRLKGAAGRRALRARAGTATPRSHSLLSSEVFGVDRLAPDRPRAMGSASGCLDSLEFQMFIKGTRLAPSVEWGIGAQYGGQ